jgi:hypothetical protein
MKIIETDAKKEGFFEIRVFQFHPHDKCGILAISTLVQIY